MLGTLARFCAAAAVLAVAALAPDAQARSLDDIIKSGSIRIGVNPNFPPMSSYGKTNQLEGFDIDIGNKIADALKVKAEFVPTETPQRVPFLIADRIDISLGALTRTAERAKLIDYTVPLHTEAMAVLTTDKEPLTKWIDLNKPESRWPTCAATGRSTISRRSCRKPRCCWSTPSPTRCARSPRAAPTRSSRTSTSSCPSPRTIPT